MSPISVRVLFALGTTGLALIGGLAACTTAEDRRQMQQESFAQEVLDEKAVGRLMAAKLAGHFGYYDEDPALTRYLELVGLSLTTHANRSELNFHFGILKSEEVNAFATPAGYIFVTLPLLKEVRSESELAGILGHEIAHVTERHMYKEIAPKREVSAGETLTRLLSRGGSDLGLSISKIVNTGMELLLEKGLGEEKEIAADQTGSILAAATGYDPQALLAFLTRLQKSAETVKISKTHPPFPRRLNELNAFLKKNGLNVHTGNEAEERSRRFKEALSRLKSGTKGNT